MDTPADAQMPDDSEVIRSVWEYLGNHGAKDQDWYFGPLDELPEGFPWVMGNEAAVEIGRCPRRPPAGMIVFMVRASVVRGIGGPLIADAMEAGRLPPVMPYGRNGKPLLFADVRDLKSLTETGLSRPQAQDHARLRGADLPLRASCSHGRTLEAHTHRPPRRARSHGRAEPPVSQRGPLRRRPGPGRRVPGWLHA